MTHPAPDLSDLTLDARLGLRRVADELRAHPDPTPVDRQLADARGRIEPWELSTDPQGFPRVVVLPEPEFVARDRPFGAIPIAARRDGLVRLFQGWARLGSHRHLQDAHLVGDLLDEMQARCAVMCEAALRDPAGDLDRVPREVREALHVIRFFTDHPPPSPAAWDDAPVLWDWWLEHDRWGVLTLTGLLDELDDPSRPARFTLVQVWDAKRREVETTQGLVRLADSVTSRMTSAITSQLSDAADECARLRTELILRERR